MDYEYTDSEFKDDFIQAHWMRARIPDFPVRTGGFEWHLDDHGCLMLTDADFEWAYIEKSSTLTQVLFSSSAEINATTIILI